MQPSTHIAVPSQTTFKSQCFNPLWDTMNAFGRSLKQPVTHYYANGKKSPYGACPSPAELAHVMCLGPQNAKRRMFYIFQPFTQTLEIVAKKTSQLILHAHKLTKKSDEVRHVFLQLPTHANKTTTEKSALEIIKNTIQEHVKPTRDSRPRILCYTGFDHDGTKESLQDFAVIAFSQYNNKHYLKTAITYRAAVKTGSLGQIKRCIACLHK